MQPPLPQNPTGAVPNATQGSSAVAGGNSAYRFDPSSNSIVPQNLTSNQPGAVPYAPQGATGTAFPGGPPLPYPAVPPVQNYGNPNVSQWQAAQNSNVAQQGYLDAQSAALGPQGQVNQAQAGVLQAQSAALPVQRAYLAEQTRANSQKLSEQQSIQAAQSNTGDILSVARAQNYRNSMAYRYQIAGLPAPVEVTLPPGFQGPMPPGVVQRLQTLADTLTAQAKNADAMEAFNVEAARIASENAGTNITAAQIAKGQVQLSLDDAELALKRAGIGVDQAKLAATQAGQAPAPGLEWDDTAQQWVTAQQKEQNKTEYDATKNGQYGAVPVGTLVSMMASTYASQADTTGKTPAPITEAQFRKALEGPPNYLGPDVINAYLAEAKARSIGNAGIQVGAPPTRGGSTTTPATPAQPNLFGTQPPTTQQGTDLTGSASNYPPSQFPSFSGDYSTPDYSGQTP